MERVGEDQKEGKGIRGDMEGLERNEVDWRQWKTVRGEDWKEFNGFERKTGGLGEIVSGRRSVEDR